MTDQHNDAPAFARNAINLASPRLGSQTVLASDDFFAAKERMLQDAPPIFVPDKYDDNGKGMDGWESWRRRDGGHDWCLVRLGTAGVIAGVDIDTSHFTGNYAPAASIEACLGEDQPGDDAAWSEIVPATSLGPSAHHFIEVAATAPFNWLRLNMWPDGGIARLRVYGQPYCEWDKRDAKVSHELSALKNGGRVVAYNDAHYGDVWAILTDGRGKDMGDGWETRRRREPGHDWLIVELGHAGEIDRIEVDTAHFKGNYPDRCSLQAARVAHASDESLVSQAMFWPELMGEKKLSADNVHTFKAGDLAQLGPVSHVRLNIHPDGGVSRLRVSGKIAH
ncbi:MAG: allantoicase [Aestuariivirgaceae bacterium]